MIKLGTTEFQRAVARADKGAGKNPLMPITEMIGIKVIDGDLILCTTDGTNQLQIILDNVDSRDLTITVKSETLAKLMSKVTSDTTTLKIQDNFLLIGANGNYKIPLEMDETDVVDFPSIQFDTEGKTVYEVDVQAIKNIVNINKASLAVTYDNPFLTGYLIDKEKVLTSDGEVICFNEIQFSNCDEDILINPQMMLLLSMCTSDNMKLVKDNSKLYFYTDNMVVFGKELEGKESYPVNEMSVYLTESAPSSCRISKSLLLGVLDRLQIFIEQYDKNGADFKFTKGNLQISSKRNSFVEEITLSEDSQTEEFSCLVDIPSLKEQLNANPADVVELHYGLENAIKLKHGRVTQVISLLEDEDD